jgi:hypothetical protein
LQEGPAHRLARRGPHRPRSAFPLVLCPAARLQGCAASTRAGRDGGPGPPFFWAWRADCRALTRQRRGARRTSPPERRVAPEARRLPTGGIRRSCHCSTGLGRGRSACSSWAPTSGRRMYEVSSRMYQRVDPTVPQVLTPLAGAPVWTRHAGTSDPPGPDGRRDVRSAAPIFSCLAGAETDGYRCGIPSQRDDGCAASGRPSGRAGLGAGPVIDCASARILAVCRSARIGIAARW